MKIYHKICNALYVAFKWITAVVVVAMLVLMLTEVVRRYIFNATFPWSDEVIRYLLIYCTFFGGVCAYYKKGLVAFTLLYDKFPAKFKSIIMVFNNVVMLVFFAFLTRFSFAKAFSKSVMKSVSTSSGLSATVPYMAIVIGLILLVIFTIDFFPELIVNMINTLRGKNISIKEEANK